MRVLGYLFPACSLGHLVRLPSLSFSRFYRDKFHLYYTPTLPLCQWVGKGIHESAPVGHKPLFICFQVFFPDDHLWVAGTLTVPSVISRFCERKQQKGLRRVERGGNRKSPSPCCPLCLWLFIPLEVVSPSALSPLPCQPVPPLPCRPISP